MSMDTCAKCGDLVDTDDDPAAYDFGDKCRCETCRAKYYTDDGQKIDQIRAQDMAWMKWALTLLLTIWSTEAYAPPAFRYDFYSDNELVRADVDQKVCGILTGFYMRHGQEGVCKRRI